MQLAKDKLYARCYVLHSPLIAASNNQPHIFQQQKRLLTRQAWMRVELSYTS